jgi:hypothetical protein
MVKTLNVSCKSISQMREYAKENDIDRGGLYDVRLGCINIWCSPEDKPEGWGEPSKGMLKHARDFVGTLTVKNEKIFIIDTDEKNVEWLENKALELIENSNG